MYVSAGEDSNGETEPALEIVDGPGSQAASQYRKRLSEVERDGKQVYKKSRLKDQKRVIWISFRVHTHKECL